MRNAEMQQIIEYFNRKRIGFINTFSVFRIEFEKNITIHQFS